ncbi:MAG: hypothetical protein ACXWKP_19750 [Bradyrhizobium sp.]
MLYRHTQRGIVILAVCLAIGGLGAAITWQTGQVSMIFMLIILVAVAVVFHSLTVEVGDNEMRWHFGPGFWTYRLALDEIRSVAVVRNHWWNGFGIRTAPGFRLYNVSGLDAVELRLKSGDIRRIGTDDPEGLADALRSAARGGDGPYSSR